MTATSLIFLTLVLLLLLISIVRFKLHPFLALTGASILLGVLIGFSVSETVATFLSGFGKTLEWIGVVIVLGAAIGEILNQTGGSKKLAETILRLVGEKKLPLAMASTGYIVSIPAFVDVAYIMLKPITEALAAKSRKNILVIGLSLSAGLTATHALIPPTPGPIAAAGILGADLGKVILINLFVALFVTGGGLLWATFFCRRYELPYDRKLRKEFEESASEETVRKGPSALASFLPILLPLALIALGTVGTKGSEDWTSTVLLAFGTPVIALLIGLCAAALLIRPKGRMKQLSHSLELAIEKAAVVLLITGAGGGFGAVIRASEIGSVVSSIFGPSSSTPHVLLPFLMAAALTTATGSLTVSMVTTSSVVAAMLPGIHLSPEFAVAAIGAGSLCVIHANASFFWLLSRLHEVPPNILYKTYSLQSICMAGSGLLALLILRALGVQ